MEQQGLELNTPSRIKPSAVAFLNSQAGAQNASLHIIENDGNIVDFNISEEYLTPIGLAPVLPNDGDLYHYIDVEELDKSINEHSPNTLHNESAQVLPNTGVTLGTEIEESEKQNTSHRIIPTGSTTDITEVFQDNRMSYSTEYSEYSSSSSSSLGNPRPEMQITEPVLQVVDGNGREHSDDANVQKCASPQALYHILGSRPPQPPNVYSRLQSPQQLNDTP